MAYIYQIENDINNKIYIGKTEFSLEKRFSEHCRDALCDTKSHRPLYAAIRKYGKEHFHISLLEETDFPEERERYWIEKLGSFKYGYNATTGGDGRKYLDYDLIIKTYQKTKSQKETAELLHIDRGTIRRIISMYAPEIQLNSTEVARTIAHKPVAKIDKNTNEIIEIYNSISEAERKNNIAKHIGSVCRGKRQTAGGYKWKYIE